MRENAGRPYSIHETRRIHAKNEDASKPMVVQKNTTTTTSSTDARKTETAYLIQIPVTTLRKHLETIQTHETNVAHLYVYWYSG